MKILKNENASLNIFSKYFFVSIIILSFVVILYAKQKNPTYFFPPFKHTWGIHKGTEENLDMLLGNKTDFDDPQGITVIKLKQWDDPNSKKDDDEVTVYGVNSGRCQIIYNKSMYGLAIYGSCGRGKGQFQTPKGITATENGDVYVADYGNGRIVHLRMPKDKLIWVKSFGEKYLKAPFDIASIPGDTLYITDFKKNSVLVFDSSGTLIREFTGFYGPKGIDVDAHTIKWSAYKGDYFVVIDSFGKRILKINRTNGIIDKIVRTNSLGLSGSKLQYLALDYLGNIHVTDYNRCQLHKFDKDLKYITSFGSCGYKDEQLDQPRGIAIWKRFGQIFVSERVTAQYFWIGLEVKEFRLTHNKNDNSVTVSFFITETAYVKARIIGKGVDLSLWKRKKRVDLGGYDEKIALPVGLDSGNYKIIFEFEPTYSSRNYLEKTFTNKIKI